LPGPKHRLALWSKLNRAAVRIAGREIGTGDLKVNGGLSKRLVLRMADPARGIIANGSRRFKTFWAH